MYVFIWITAYWEIAAHSAITTGLLIYVFPISVADHCLLFPLYMFGRYEILVHMRIYVADTSDLQCTSLLYTQPLWDQGTMVGPHES